MDKIIMHIDVNNAFLSWSAIYLLKKGHPYDIRYAEAIIVGDENKKIPSLFRLGIIKLQPIVTYRWQRGDP